VKERWIRILAACEVLGGALAVIGYAIYAVTRPGVLAGWQDALGIAFAGLAVYAGVQLLRGRDIGVVASMVAQGLQIVSFTVVPAARFVALAGLRVDLLIASNGVHARFGGGGEFIAIPFARDGTLYAVGTELHFGFRVAPEGLEASTTTIAINFVAVYFLWRLLSLFTALRRASTASAPSSAPAI
jgi:hypothetical protein